MPLLVNGTHAEDDMASMKPAKIRKLEEDTKVVADSEAAPKPSSSHPPHHSWAAAPVTFDFAELERLQATRPRSALAESYQHKLIPVYDAKRLDFCRDEAAQRDLYTHFFDHAGAVIVKRVYSIGCMAAYTRWSENTLEESKNDPNTRHPKQPSKRLINDVIHRMVRSDPDLLMDLIANPTINALMDTLLGFGRFGALTTHWIEAGGDRQRSHVDYPLHVGSGAFWEGSVDKMKRLTTREQVNHILNRFSVQILIASDAMDVSNGSTEIVPCSHLMSDLAAHIHDPTVYAGFENRFVNVTLEEGDVLIFNRGLCHRGGWNRSAKRRNSLIMQSVWMWGIGQEIMDSSWIISRLEASSSHFQALTDEDKERFAMRLKAPYPIDVKLRT